MTAQPPPPPTADGGWIHGLIHSIKGLTFANALIIILLVIVAIPAYAVWRVLNDEDMLYRFLSSYREIPNSVPGSNCTLREVSVKGGTDSYGISTNFASLGNDRWQIGVTLNHKPTESEITSYCEVLNKVIDKMRDPTMPTPTAPDAPNEPLIWPYPSDPQ